MSHTKVHDTLTKPVLPTKGAVEMITEVLADVIRGADADAEVDRLLGLWQKASVDNPTPSPTPPPSVGDPEAAVRGEQDIELLNNGERTSADHQKQGESSGREYVEESWQEKNTVQLRSAEGLPSIRLDLGPLSLAYTAARILDIVAPLHPAPLDVSLKDVDSTEPTIRFQLDTAVDKDNQVRTVDLFADALGVEAHPAVSGGRLLRAVYQGVRVIVTTVFMDNATWRPQVSWDYPAGQHAEELLMLAKVLRALDSAHLHELTVYYFLEQDAFLTRLTVSAEGLRRIEKMNGSPVEPDNVGRHVFGGLVADRQLAVYRLA
ncbi:hypothetical protein [Nocardiopsis sp. Huas11]|uniref:hypothetical protein n=1 Tax=Nocardiopsis sp. Huas11 TaxID=2183912 RepID=UPI001F44FDEE|nr:hypothetical protein [Nocardiopsis sp. Huas11]